MSVGEKAVLRRKNATLLTLGRRPTSSLSACGSLMVALPYAASVLSKCKTATLEGRRFFFNDFCDLRLRNRTHFLLACLRRAFLDAKRLQDQPRSRRILHDEGERAVVEDRELDRNNRAALILGRFVELGHELANVHTRRAECRTDGRRRCRLPSRDLKFNFLNYSCHKNFVISEAN